MYLALFNEEEEEEGDETGAETKKLTSEFLFTASFVVVDNDVRGFVAVDAVIEEVGGVAVAVDCDVARVCEMRGVFSTVRGPSNSALASIPLEIN